MIRHITQKGHAAIVAGMLLLGCSSDNPVDNRGTGGNFSDRSGIPAIPDDLQPRHHDRAGFIPVYFYVAGSCQDSVWVRLDQVPITLTVSPPIPTLTFAARQWHRVDIPAGSHSFGVQGIRYTPNGNATTFDIWDTGTRAFDRGDTLVFRCP